MSKIYFPCDTYLLIGRSNKLKVQALEKGSAKERKMRAITVNYLYRYGTLIAFANYLLEMKESLEPEVTFQQWLREHREITKLLERRSLD